MPGREPLTYLDSDLFNTLPNESGEDSKVTFFVTVRNIDAQNRKEVYALDAVTTEGYAVWELEHEIEEEITEEIFPLVVSDERLGSEGLVAFMKRRYLTSAKPRAVNEIRQFLFGPLDLEEELVD